MNGPCVDKLGTDAVEIHGVNALDERAGKGVLHAKQDANFLHGAPLFVAELGDRCRTQTARRLRLWQP
jgi:hypothetical protein